MQVHDRNMASQMQSGGRSRGAAPPRPPLPLSVQRATDLHTLVDRLVGHLETAWPDPFERVPVAVASGGMGRWVRHELATRLTHSRARTTAACAALPLASGTFDHARMPVSARAAENRSSGALKDAASGNLPYSTLRRPVWDA